MATATKASDTGPMATQESGGEPQCDPTLSQKTSLGVDIALEVTINAPRDRVFDAMVNDIDEWFRPMEGPSMKLSLEPFAGGRFLRDLSSDLGEGAGHWWGTVQVYKPGELLEIHGPLFMSEPALSHISFRLEDDVDRTKLKFHHRAIGAITDGVLENARTNWTKILTKGLKDHVERHH